MQRIVYVSAASRTFSPQSLAELLSQSRANNREKGISGMLFYYRDSFLQVLEGPITEVGIVTNTIARDPRHSDFRVLSTEIIEQKMFGEWTMGFVEARHAANLVDEYAGKDVPFPLASLNAEQAKDMLQFFKGVVSNDLP